MTRLTLDYVKKAPALDDFREAYGRVVKLGINPAQPVYGERDEPLQRELLADTIAVNTSTSWNSSHRTGGPVPR